MNSGPREAAEYDHYSTCIHLGGAVIHAASRVRFGQLEQKKQSWTFPPLHGSLNRGPTNLCEVKMKKSVPFCHIDNLVDRFWRTPENAHSAAGKIVLAVAATEALKALRLKQQHALERLSDSFTEGLIEKEQFTSRMARTKGRIAEFDAQIQAYFGDINQLEHVRLAADRL